MQTKDESFLTPIADVDARRELIIAAREVISYKLSYVASAHNLSPQNLYTWLKGSTTLSESLQFRAMGMYGFYPSGRLSDTALHAWVINGLDGAKAAEKILTYEDGIVDVRINPAYTHVRGRRRDPNEVVRNFIGVSIQWALPISSGKSMSRRLIMTATSGTWPEEAFMDWVTQLFAARTAKGQSVEIGDEVNVVQQAAEAIWRWHFKPREADGSRAKTTPNKGLLPFDQDIIGQQKAARESALSVLEDMAPRFKRLADAVADHRGTPVSSTDLSLIRRANAVIAAPAPEVN
jgi:hypothetical protein